MKICKHCNLEKPIEEFAWSSKIRGYKKNYCKKCANKMRDNKRKSDSKEKKWLKDKVNKLRRNFKLEYKEYLEMIVIQDNKCKICGNEETIKTHSMDSIPKHLAVDHCHNTGKIRGLLCMRCNTILGKVNEDEDLLKKMIHYLQMNK